MCSLTTDCVLLLQTVCSLTTDCLYTHQVAGLLRQTEAEDYKGYVIIYLLNQQVKEKVFVCVCRCLCVCVLRNMVCAS